MVYGKVENFIVMLQRNLSGYGFVEFEKSGLRRNRKKGVLDSLHFSNALLYCIVQIDTFKRLQFFALFDGSFGVWLIVAFYL
jgi:hypothetical protein